MSEKQILKNQIAIITALCVLVNRLTKDDEVTRATMKMLGDAHDDTKKIIEGE